MRWVKLLAVQVFATCILTTLAFSATVKIASVTLSEPPAGTPSYEKFGVLYFPFVFNMSPQLFVLCDPGASCANNVGVSDFVCVTNNQFGEGVVAMMSDLEVSLNLNNIPPDFPCQLSSSQVTFLTETGKPQTLSPKGGFPTTLPTGAPGTFIKLNAQSDVETTTATSDVLTVYSL